MYSRTHSRLIKMPTKMGCVIIIPGNYPVGYLWNIKSKLYFHILNLILLQGLKSTIEIR